MLSGGDLTFQGGGSFAAKESACRASSSEPCSNFVSQLLTAGSSQAEQSAAHDRFIVLATVAAMPWDAILSLLLQLSERSSVPFYILLETLALLMERTLAKILLEPVAIGHLELGAAVWASCTFPAASLGALHGGST